MGFLDNIRKGKEKLNNVRKKVDEFLDRGSELENKIKDIKEDTSGKILEKAKKHIGIDDLDFGDSGPNIFNNPSFIKEQDQYNQKVESFASFIKPGIPHLVFEVETEKSVTTKASKNAHSALTQQELKDGLGVLGKAFGYGNLKNIEISQDIPNVSKQFKIPIDPTFLSTSYDFNFSQYNARTDLDFAKFLSEDSTGVDKAIEAAKAAGNLAANYARNETASSEFAKAASLQTGVAINPNMENAFTGVDFRNLSFSFELIPKNENQAIEMQKIIHLLKYWSHPDTIQNTNGKVLRFPYNWSIHYNDGQGGTTGVSFKTKICYCKSIKVEYGSSNGYILMKDNSPACVKISLSFTENAYITRGDIGTSYTNGGNY